VMHARLNRLPIPPEEIKFPDISLLSPADQDRVEELYNKCGNASAGIGPVISVNELDELKKLLANLPLLGLDDRFGGPRIEVPRDLEFYWKWRQRTAGWDFYSFDRLGKVQTVRFVELCARYKNPVGIGRQNRIIPLEEWETDDKAEMQALLDKAAACKEPIVLY
jgi:hypothetical protein